MNLSPVQSNHLSCKSLQKDVFQNIEFDMREGVIKAKKLPPMGTALLAKVLGFLMLTYCCLILKVTLRMMEPERSFRNVSTLHEIRFANFTHSYNYTLLPSRSRLSSCDGSGKNNPLMIATVLSIANHTEMRRAIRESWASAEESESIKTGRVIVFFIISSPASTNELYELQKEQIYDDLIVTNIFESYETLHLKVYASFIFHQNYCPMAQFLMKVDDDVAIHLDRMDNLWQRTDRATLSIFCLVCSKSKPERNSSHKWFVSYDDWPDQFYPPFCSGPMYVVGKEAGWRILNSAHLFEPLKLEDVFYTGIIAEKVNVSRENWGNSVLLIWGNFSNFWRRPLRCSPSGNPLVFSMHSLSSPEDLRKGFQRMKDYRCIY